MPAKRKAACNFASCQATRSHPKSPRFCCNPKTKVETGKLYLQKNDKFSIFSFRAGSLSANARKELNAIALLLGRPIESVNVRSPRFQACTEERQMGEQVSLVINIDGAARGNPGPAAFAYLVRRNGKAIAREKGRIGNATNNVAEYTALIRALERAIELKASDVLILSDSELLVRQMNGHYRVKNDKLLPLYAQASELRKGLPSVRISHVPREQNAEADRLCNEALDEATQAPEPAILDGDSWQRVQREIEGILATTPGPSAASQIIAVFRRHGFVPPRTC
jgi:ribonuclease HI